MRIPPQIRVREVYLVLKGSREAGRARRPGRTRNDEIRVTNDEPIPKPEIGNPSPGRCPCEPLAAEGCPASLAGCAWRTASSGQRSANVRLLLTTGPAELTSSMPEEVP